MNTIVNLLLRLNDALYNLYVHSAILALWIYIFVTTNSEFIRGWIGFGLIFYIALVIVRMREKKNYNPLVYYRNFFKKKETTLSFLVGLNIPAVLGPVAVIILLLLIKTGPKKQ